jgi:hypothetical protein
MFSEKTKRVVSNSWKFVKEIAGEEFLSLFLTTLTVLIVHYVWVSNYSDVCLNKEYSNFRKEYIDQVFISDNVGVVLETARVDINADLMIAHLYTDDYKYVIEYQYAMLPNYRRSKDTSLIPVAGDPYYEDTYEEHHFQRCHISRGDEITNTKIKGLISDNTPITTTVSCPLIDVNNFIIGSITSYYSSFNSLSENPESYDDSINSIENKMRVYSVNVEKVISQ